MTGALAASFIFLVLPLAAENTYNEKVVIVIGPHREVIMGSELEMNTMRILTSIPMPSQTMKSGKRAMRGVALSAAI